MAMTMIQFNSSRSPRQFNSCLCVFSCDYENDDDHDDDDHDDDDDDEDDEDDGGDTKCSR